MRRLRVAVLVMLVLCGLVTIGRDTALGQDGTPTAGGQHPVVGTWSVANPDDPSEEPSLSVFNAGGTFMELEFNQGQPTTAVGVWQPTGDQTAQLTIWSRGPDGTAVIRADIEVAGDGQSITGTYTVEFTSADGSMDTGEIGPFRAAGTRLTVEPQGTPVAGSFEDIFGTPEATPAG